MIEQLNSGLTYLAILTAIDALHSTSKH